MGADKSIQSARTIVDTKADAVVVAEIELRQIAVQVLFRAMLINAFHATLEHAEIVLNRVGVDDRATFVSDILLCRMLGRLVVNERGADVRIEAAFVGVERAFLVDVCRYQLSNVFLVGGLDMESADLAATFDQTKHRALVGRAGLAAARERGAARRHCRCRAGLLAEIGFVGFDGLAFAANRAKVAFAHGFTNAMGQEPSRLERDFQNAVKLVGADTLLAGAHQVDCLQPLVQRDMAFFEDRADANRELLAAFAALLEAVALNAFRVFLGRLGVDAFQLVDAAHAATVRANWTFRPQDAFHMSEGSSLVVKIFSGQNRHDDDNP